MEAKLAVRVDADHRNHHLWNNHGTWWCHYTIHPTAWTKRRVRVSLGTRDEGEARERRDALFAALRAGVDGARAGAAWAGKSAARGRVA